MILKDFIKKYSMESERGYCENLFEGEVEEDGGFIMPDGFS